ncbi:hypothetical protein D3C78_1875920 [compost metagenome]
MRFVAQQQVIARRIRSIPSVMAKDLRNHELRPRQAAFVVTHPAFLSAGARRGQFQGVCAGAAEQQVLLEETGKDRRQT